MYGTAESAYRRSLHGSQSPGKLSAAQQYAQMGKSNGVEKGFKITAIALVSVAAVATVAKAVLAATAVITLPAWIIPAALITAGVGVLIGVVLAVKACYENCKGQPQEVSSKPQAQRPTTPRKSPRLRQKRTRGARSPSPTTVTAPVSSPVQKTLKESKKILEDLRQTVAFIENFKDRMIRDDSDIPTAADVDHFHSEMRRVKSEFEDLLKTAHPNLLQDRSASNVIKLIRYSVSKFQD